MEYYTGIMKELLVDLIDASAAKNPKLMLRRTESVVEKMLTNWMSICMYSCLRVRPLAPAQGRPEVTPPGSGGTLLALVQIWKGVPRRGPGAGGTHLSS